MRKYLSTGLVILLPLVLTILIVRFLINFLTKPFLGLTERIVEFAANSPFLHYSHPLLLEWISKIFILFLIAVAILLIGLIGRLFLIDYLFKLGDKLFHNLPFINKIYKACQDVVHSIFSSSSSSFSQVVFVPFPSINTLSVGLVTKDSISIIEHSKASDLVPVFVPGTPNPSVGFLLMFKKEQLLFVNMKIDEAMKFVVSCGVVMTDFKVENSPTIEIEKRNENG